MTLLQKRIPVTEETWEELAELKHAGQTYDELLEEMIEEHKKTRLFRDMKQILKDSKFTPLNEV